MPMILLSGCRATRKVVAGTYFCAFIVKFSLLSPQQSNNMASFPVYIASFYAGGDTICACLCLQR